MKKNLFYLFALICSVSLFTACSDDDDAPSWTKLSEKEFTAGTLSLEANIPASSDASVQLAMTDAQNGVLTLNKAVRGMDKVEVNVTVAEQTDGSFRFQGETTTSPATKAAWQLLNGVNVKVSGSVALDGKAEVNVSTEASGNLVKKFLLCDDLYIPDPKDRVNVYAPGRLSWESTYGEGDNVGLASSNIATVGTNALTAVMMQLLKDVEFKADGSIVANYAKEVNVTIDQIVYACLGMFPSTDGIEWITSPANLAYWYVKDNQIYVLLNIPAIVTEAMKDSQNSSMTPETIMQMVEMVKGMSGADIKNLLAGLLDGLEEGNILKKLDLSKISDSDIEKLIGYVVDGFPLDYRTVSQLQIVKNEEVVRTVNDLSIFLSKDLLDIFMPAVYPIMPDADVLVKEVKIPLFGKETLIWPLISGLTGLQSLTEIEPLWGATTVFELGLSLGDGSYKDTPDAE